MQQAKNEFTVKLVGNLKTPEIKANLAKFPQNAYALFCIKKKTWGKEAYNSWNSLDEASKKEFIEMSDKQKQISKEIRELCKQKYSATVFLSDLDKKIETLKDEYQKVRVEQTYPKRRAQRPSKGFSAFLKEWSGKHLKEGENVSDKMPDVKKAWSSLSREEKGNYFKAPN